MNDDAAFLARVAENPADIAPRLIYADWLEELDDPRAKLIRIAEEMRAIPVYSDRFWELKARHEKLAEVVDGKWLRLFHYNRDSLPLFAHGIPDGWRERWRLIRELMYRWFGPSLPDVGGQKEAIAATETRLSHKLPPSLCEWIAFTNDVVVSATDEQIHQLNTQPVLSLRFDSGSGFLWCIRLNDLTLDDPPVYPYGSGEEEIVPLHERASDTNLASPTLSQFAFEYVMSLSCPSGGRFMAPVEFPQQLMRDLLADFPVHFTLGKTHFFERDNIMVRLIPDHVAPSGIRMIVDAAGRLLFESVPPILWEYAQKGYAFEGAFCKNDLHAP
jgi:uncharacterized protein (TIGR02996 family)